MDEAAYRQKFVEVVKRPCAFEKAVLARCVACERSERIHIAERETVACRNAPSFSRCTELHDHLRRAFAFALGRLHDDEALPHAQEMRVQCGGLKGLQQVLIDSAEVENVDALSLQAMQRGDRAEIPWSEVVHAAAQCYQGRHG